MQLVDEIIAHAAEVFGRTPTELTGQSRARPIVEARQAAMWALRQRYPLLSLQTIGTALGGRHYSTVRHALQSVEQRAEQSAHYRRQVQQLIERVAPPKCRASDAAPLLQRAVAS
jgi:chromosomal replication initiator protein